MKWLGSYGVTLRHSIINGFRSISLKRLDTFNSNMVYGYIIGLCRSSLNFKVLLLSFSRRKEVAKAPCLLFAEKRVLTSVFSTEEMTRCSVMGHRNIKVRDKKGLDVYKRSEIEHKLLGHYISFVGHLELLKI